MTDFIISSMCFFITENMLHLYGMIFQMEDKDICKDVYFLLEETNLLFRIPWQLGCQ